MVAQDDLLGPAIRFGVSKNPMKNGTVRDFAMEWRPRHEWQPRLKREPVRCAQPGFVISKSRALSGTDPVIMQGSDKPRLIAHKNFDRPFHKAVGSFLMHTRLGSRSSSKSNPSSSRRASIRLLKASPKPRTNSAIA